MSSDGSSTSEEHGTLDDHSQFSEMDSQFSEMDSQARINGAEEAQELPRSEGNPGEALESHEVIELQAFIERKEWIEDKIKVGVFSYL